MFCFFVFITILVVLVFLYFSKLKFDFSYFESGGLEIFLKFLFLRFKVYSSRGKSMNFRLRSETGKRSLNHRKKKGKKASKKVFGLDLNFSNVKMLLAPLPKFFFFIVKGLQVKNFEFYCMVSGDDAADIAEHYAIVSGLFCWFSGLVSSLISFQIKRVNIVPDFYCKGRQLALLFKLQIGFGRLIFGLFRYLFELFFNFIRCGFRIKRGERFS